METVTISLKVLYDKFGSELRHGEIVKSVDGNSENEYYDLYDDNRLACMDGETCEIVEEDEDKFILKVVEEDSPTFVLSREEMGIGAFRVK